MAACLIASSGIGDGDAAFCAQLCDTVADCLDTMHQMECNTSTVSQYGHGICKIIGISPQTDGGSEASQDAAGE
jgi:hypothetical protein